LEAAVSLAKNARRAPRWHRRPDVRPRQILEAAFRVFGARGLHQATLDDVAREAGITKGTIYLYFPSKAALFTAMLKARVNDIMPSVAAPAGGRDALTTRQILGTLGPRLYQFFQSPAYLAMYRTVVSEASQFPEATAHFYREGILQASQRLADVIRRGITAGEFRQVDPVIAARAGVGMFQIFAVSQGLLGGQRILPIADAKIVRTVTEIFLRGLLVPRRPPAPGRPARGAQ
jgi:AcrR family transcriptional regulator